MFVGGPGPPANQHPLTSKPVTVERLFAFPHVVVELSGSETRTEDGFIGEQGVERRLWIEPPAAGQRRTNEPA